MARRDVIVVGASAGGVEALMNLVRHLPSRLPAAVLVTLHVPATGTSVLPAILDRSGALPAAHAEDREPLQAGRIYVARPDFHLLVQRGHVRVVAGPTENGHRPAVDPLFRSAAVSYGPRVAGVVLSGTRDDGTAGLIAIKQHGGVALVQDPNDALFPGMPRNALDHVAVDDCLPASEIASRLVELAGEPDAGAARGPDQPYEDRGEAAATAAIEREDRIVGLPDDEPAGTPTALSCPHCGGGLSEIHEGGLSRFRCRVGHVFSPDSLVEEQADALETALWSALNALQERAEMARRLAARSRERGHNHSVRKFERLAEDVERRASTIQNVLLAEKAWRSPSVEEPSPSDETG